MNGLSPPAFKQPFRSARNTKETAQIQSLIRTMNLAVHTEGGYFAETDRDPLRVPNPFERPEVTKPLGDEHLNATRSASTTIFYLLTPSQPLGVFHRNKARTMHVLHKGRGRYVLIHPAENGGKARIETFDVGHDVEKGERLQWMVEGGVWKSSFLLPDSDGEDGVSKDGLLISEVCSPSGFAHAMMGDQP